MSRLDRLEVDSGELRRAMASMEMRLGSGLTAVHGELVRLVDYLKAYQADSERLGGCEVEIRDPKRRVDSVESGSGPRAS